MLKHTQKGGSQAACINTLLKHCLPPGPLPTALSLHWHC